MRFDWRRNVHSKAEMWDCYVMKEGYYIYGKYVGYIRHFQHEGHDHWNAYRVKYASGQSPNKFMFTAKAFEEIKAAFEVAVRIE